MKGPDVYFKDDYRLLTWRYNLCISLEAFLSFLVSMALFRLQAFAVIDFFIKIP